MGPCCFTGGKDAWTNPRGFDKFAERIWYGQSIPVVGHIQQAATLTTGSADLAHVVGGTTIGCQASLKCLIGHSSYRSCHVNSTISLVHNSSASTCGAVPKSDGGLGHRLILAYRRAISIKSKTT